MWYWAGEISLRWVQFDLLTSRDLLRWFGGSEGKGTCTSPSLLGHWHWISAFAYVHWGYQSRISQLNSGVCESFKKTGNGGKSSFWNPPVSLGSTKFSKTCIACTTCWKFLTHLIRISCLLQNWRKLSVTQRSLTPSCTSSTQIIYIEFLSFSAWVGNV